MDKIAKVARDITFLVTILTLLDVKFVKISL